MEPKEPENTPATSPAPETPGGGSAVPEGKGPAEYQHRASVAGKAFRGLLWMVSTGAGARGVSLASTLLLTRYVAPEDYGDVQNSYVLVWMVDLLTQLGVPQYIAGRADLTPKKIHHATFFFHLFGFVGLFACLFLPSSIGAAVGAPNMARYMPGFVVGTLLTRIATIPDRMLVRELRFREASVIRAVGEVVYAISSVLFAMAATRLDFHLFGMAFVFGGGFAIVWGGIARGLFRAVVTIAVTRVRDWLAIIRIDRESLFDLFAFGIPITVAGLGSLGARRWNNWVMGNLYGPGPAGLYNLAFNVADTPPSVVGEALGDVLAPSFAKVEPKDRPQELVRWVQVSALVCFPLGVGLSAVADSLSFLFGEKWLTALPMLVLLGSLSLTRPIIGTVFSYLQMLGRTRTLMLLEWAKAAGIVVVVFTFGHALRAAAPQLDAQYGPLFACGAVGFVMFANTLAYQVIGARAAGMSAGKLVWPSLPPLLACVPLVLAVLAVRFAFGDVSSKLMLILRLVCEITAGGLAFVVAAWLVARQAALVFFDLLRNALKRRRGQVD